MFIDLINRQTSQIENTMKVNHILNNLLHNASPNMHVTRRKAVSSCIHSLINGACATVTSIGRGIESSAIEKHKIKRADRLLSNTTLFSERLNIYKAHTTSFIQPNSKPVNYIDWSDLDRVKKNLLIRASLAMQGRNIMIYEEVHDITTKEKPATHTAFLKQLAQALPNQCTPIIVTDVGFKVPWFSSVLKQGWHFVGRARLPSFYSTDGKHWQTITEFYSQATNRPKMINGWIARSNPLAVTMILYKASQKGRKDLNRYGKPRKINQSKKYGKGANDPWLLVTSLPCEPTLKKEAINIYKTRMQIEEGFRDIKSQRYGFGLGLHLSYKTQRIHNLILLSTLANWLIIIGTVAILRNKHRRYQANSIKNKSVLSVHFIGLRVIADKQLSITHQHIALALQRIFQLTNLDYKKLD
jgi:hypothetical protein